MKFRNIIIPVANFGSSLAIPLFVIGLIMGIEGLEFLGILFFSFAVIFQAATLPVEFNASRRALVQMKNLNLVMEDEEKGVKKVLGAAAMTYVAALAVSLANLLRLLIIVMGGRNKRR